MIFNGVGRSGVVGGWVDVWEKHFMRRPYRGTHKMCMITFGLTVGLDAYGAGL